MQKYVFKNKFLSSDDCFFVLLMAECNQSLDARAFLNRFFNHFRIQEIDVNTLAKQQMTQERRAASVPASRVAKRVASVFAAAFGGMCAGIDRMHALCAWIGLNTEESRGSRRISGSGNSITKERNIIRGIIPRYAGGTVTA